MKTITQKTLSAPVCVCKKLSALLLAFLLPLVVFAQNNVTVSGTILDEQDMPVVGATVAVVGQTNKGALSDLDGHFSITGIPANSTLRISYVGYKTQEIALAGQTSLNIKLIPDSELLDEVVVVGYGTQKKVNVTGAVSAIDSKALEARPVQNIGQALQGAIPGLNFNVTSGGGALDSKMSFNVRGTGTIGEGSSSAPLVLIDGTEGDMNSLNPNDIESISVLKDAASASIYGARGAFGVVLVTTKSGKSGATRINYTGNVRFSDALQIPKMLDSYRFAQLWNRAAANNGEAPKFNDATLERIKSYMDWQAGNGPEVPGTIPNPENPNIWAAYTNANANTDWFAEMYKNWVPSYEHNLSISGGSDKITYLISGGLLNQNGLIRHGKDVFNRFNLTGKITAQLYSWLSLTYNNKWVREDFSRPSYLTGGFFHNIARRWPTNPVYDPNGYLLDGMETIALEDKGIDRSQKDYLYQQLKAVFTPIENWNIHVEGNYNTIFDRDHWDVLPIYAHDVKGNPYLVVDGLGSTPGESKVYESALKQNYFSGNIYSDYSFSFNDAHNFTLMAGINGELVQTENVGGEKKDLITPKVPTIDTATNDKPTLFGGYNHWSLVGLYARLNYNYKERYLLELNVRHDGASRFVDDKRWGTFPSLSAGWNIANEEFFAPANRYISTLKLRASWGQLGNMNTNNWYPFYQSMPIGTANSRWLINGQKQNTAGTPGIVSSLLTWETIESWDVGLDWNALNGRLSGSFDIYNRITKNMVGPAPELSSILGTNPPRINNTDMQSRGWELEIGWRDNIQDFSYGAKLVLSDDTQTILRYPNEAGSLNTWREGQNFGDIWGYQTIGIAKTEKEMTDHLAKVDQSQLGSKWAMGDIMYADLNGDGKINSGKNTINDHGDLIVIGNDMPHYRYGITLDAAWRGIDFSIFMQGVGKRDYSKPGEPYFNGPNGNIWQSAGFEEHWDFFRPEGDPLGANIDAYYPRPNFGGDKNFKSQTRWVLDASYMRIKNMQLGYTLPQAWMQKIYVKNLRVYISADNLVTFTKMPKIYDPELTGGSWGAGKLYPLSRTISVGLNLNF